MLYFTFVYCFFYPIEDSPVDIEDIDFDEEVEDVKPQMLLAKVKTEKPTVVEVKKERYNSHTP